MLIDQGASVQPVASSFPLDPDAELTRLAEVWADTDRRVAAAGEDEDADTIVDEMGTVEAAIVGTDPRTVVGAAAKGRVLIALLKEENAEHHDDIERMAFSLAKDVVRLGQAAPDVGVASCDTRGPDPVYALIEAEHQAEAALDAICARLDDLSERESKPARMQIGLDIYEQTRPDDPNFEPYRRTSPIYARDRASILMYFNDPAGAVEIVANGLRTVTSTELIGTVEEHLAAWDTEEARLKAERETLGIDEARAAESEAGEALQDAMAAVFEVTPTTPAGLLAVTALLEKRVRGGVPADDYLPGYFAAVRSMVAPLRPSPDAEPAGEQEPAVPFLMAAE